MAMGLLERFIPEDMSIRAARLTQQELADTNKYLIEALTAHKRNGLRLAVRAHWVAFRHYRAVAALSQFCLGNALL